MLSAIIKVLILIILVSAIAWLGMCAYANFFQKPATGMPEMPDIDEAEYAIQIKNTGGLILTDNYDIHGANIGSRVFVLESYWELSGKNFRFRDQTLVLDESIFGEIIVRRR